MRVPGFMQRIESSLPPRSRASPSPCLERLVGPRACRCLPVAASPLAGDQQMPGRCMYVASGLDFEMFRRYEMNIPSRPGSKRAGASQDIVYLTIYFGTRLYSDQYNNLFGQRHRSQQDHVNADSFMPEDEQSLMNTSSRVALDTPQSITSKTPLHVWGWINTVVDQSQSKHRCPFNSSKHQAQSMDWQHP